MIGRNEEHYEIRNAAAAHNLLFLCDHAANAVPAELGTLGLSPADFQAHIAYDIGAAPLTRALADRFGAPAILARWSRLLVDLNRGADDPTVVMKLSDGRIIPDNRMLDKSAVLERLARYHGPYHERIAGEIAVASESSVGAVLVSMHSFTPVWRGK